MSKQLFLHTFSFGQHLEPVRRKKSNDDRREKVGLFEVREMSCIGHHNAGSSWYSHHQSASNGLKNWLLRQWHIVVCKVLR